MKQKRSQFVQMMQFQFVCRKQENALIYNYITSLALRITAVQTSLVAPMQTGLFVEDQQMNAERAGKRFTQL